MMVCPGFASMVRSSMVKVGIVNTRKASGMKDILFLFAEGERARLAERFDTPQRRNGGSLRL
jgi:hypothetical protein